jgi:hypothetical protein
MSHPCTDKTWDNVKKKWDPRECRWARSRACKGQKKSVECRAFKREFF